jgi:xanthine dehydrogenase accessory factor
MDPDWLEAATALRREGRPFVLATVVAREAPQAARMGAKAIVLPGGELLGWIGGGCVRPTVVREALAAMRDGRPRLVRINPDAAADCREGVRVFAMTCEGEGAVDVYLEPVLPRPELLVLGRTPVAESLARLGAAVGLLVRVADPLASAERFPEAAEVGTDPAALALGASPDAAVVVATQGEGDEEALEAAVRGEAGYVGLVASRKKAAALLAHLRDRGVPEERIARVRSPAGLDIGAATPAEIALSIVAEVVGVRRGVGAADVGGEGGMGVGAAGGVRGGGGGVVEAGVAGGGGGTGTGTGTGTGSGSGSVEGVIAVDPVCGMAVEVRGARHVVEHEGRRYHFCCPRCRAAFEREPGRYLAPVGGSA